MDVVLSPVPAAVPLPRRRWAAPNLRPTPTPTQRGMSLRSSRRKKTGLGVNGGEVSRDMAEVEGFAMV